MWRGYALGVAAGALLVGLAYGWSLKTSNDALREDLAALRANLAGCEGRVNDIREDKESDDEIDRLSDDELDALGAEWMRRDPESRLD